ncbi:ssDNA-binding protein [Mesorhizobium sp. B2-8-9]|uniref:ssDNA-binding protein n=1 Tax=Mesorhizobium sp. B2-8-9 TaxID=2589899 RepID=UPI00112D3A42|nr:ssDNA-binding protein [Mesorhizobium sp. B2-8-9]TPI86433.1 DUF2815 family protein [Mesorhizobium sp. B2-8-9]
MAFKPSFNAEKGTFKVLVRLSYCRMDRKTASVEGGKLAYRTNGLLYKETEEGKASIAVAQQAAKHLIGKEWPGKDPVKLLQSFDSKRRPIHDGDQYFDSEGNVREHYEGTRYLKLTNDRKPKLKKRNGEDCDAEEAEELFQSGNWAVAYGHYYAVKDKAKGGNGMFATLDALQYYKKDEQFSGGGIDDDEIDNLGDDEDDFDEKPKNKKASSIDDDEI